MADDKAVNFAKNNDESMFYTYYKNRFEDIIFNRFQQNDEFAKFVMSNEDVLSAIMKQMLPLIYQDLITLTNQETRLYMSFLFLS